MNMLAPLLRTDPASPRLTVYDEARGTRMEFSAQTLDNWANKVANMLLEEFELGADGIVGIDLPVSWQSAVIALGTYNASLALLIDAAAAAPSPPSVIFTSVEDAARWAEVPDCVVVSDDPFGRGVVESGGRLPEGTVDFGPTVRFYGDQYFGASPDLGRYEVADVGAERYLVPDWHSAAEFERYVLAPLAGGGSVVLATGLVSTDRLDEIANAEKVTRTLTAD